MFLKENVGFENLTFLTWFDILTFLRVKPKNECHGRVLRPKRPIKQVSHDSHATFSFCDLT